MGSGEVMLLTIGLARYMRVPSLGVMLFTIGCVRCIQSSSGKCDVTCSCIFQQRCFISLFFLSYDSHYEADLFLKYSILFNITSIYALKFALMVKHLTTKC